MKVATPHWLPEGDSSSAGMIVSVAATKKACSVAVRVSSGSGSATAAAAAAGACACAGAAGASPAATAVPAPRRKLRLAIGLLSSGVSVVVLSAVLLRSEEHTSELQSLRHLVCRLLLEKKKNKIA